MVCTIRPTHDSNLSLSFHLLLYSTVDHMIFSLQSLVLIQPFDGKTFQESIGHDEFSIILFLDEAWLDR